MRVYIHKYFFYSDLVRVIGVDHLEQTIHNNLESGWQFFPVILALDFVFFTAGGFNSAACDVDDFFTDFFNDAKAGEAQTWINP